MCIRVYFIRSMKSTVQTPHRGGRPRQVIKRERINLTLHPDIRRAAQQLAFAENRSLSSLVELCLRREIARAELSRIPSSLAEK